jgi:opacity protein-like surface antigen
VRNDDGLDAFGRFGGGVGYQFNRWFRADVTLDSRSSTRIKTEETLDYNGPTDASGHVIGLRNTVNDSFRVKDYTGLLNGYIDLPVTPSLTPYVGAGVGVVIHNVEHRQINQSVRCVDTLNCSPTANGTLANPYDRGNIGLNWANGGASGHQTSTKMAAALMAGVSYKVSENSSLDVGWRWLHVDGTSFNTRMTQNNGTATGTVITTYPTSKISIPDQDIQELRVGYRININ